MHLYLFFYSNRNLSHNSSSEKLTKLRKANFLSAVLAEHSSLPRPNSRTKTTEKKCQKSNYEMNPFLLYKNCRDSISHLIVISNHSVDLLVMQMLL